jgi:hypothetical protein
MQAMVHCRKGDSTAVDTHPIQDSLELFENKPPAITTFRHYCFREGVSQACWQLLHIDANFFCLEDYGTHFSRKYYVSEAHS